MINDFISIGKITSTFGLKGNFKVASSGDILSSLKPNSTFYLKFQEIYKPFKILKIRRDKRIFIIEVNEFKSIEKAEALIGQLVYFPKAESESLLEDGELFAHQLIGLNPFFKDFIYSKFKVIEVLDNPVHPILLFSDSETEILIPYINKFVGKVDLQNNKVEILNWEEWILAD